MLHLMKTTLITTKLVAKLWKTSSFDTR